VVDEAGTYKGLVDFDTVLEAINDMRPDSNRESAEEARP
jgi:hypothetical protein